MTLIQRYPAKAPKVTSLTLGWNRDSRKTLGHSQRKLRAAQA